MIIIDCEQGSLEWVQARLGIPTASCFDKILTPKTLKPSKSATSYMHELCAEWLLGVPMDPIDTDWMQRGRELEPQAIKMYAMQRDCDVTRVGLCLNDDRTVGASPDGVAGEGLLELKCPGPKQHIANLLNGGIEVGYRCQLQGQMYVTGSQWVDAMSYHPTMPASIVRVERDEAFQTALGEALSKFVEDLAAMRGRLEAIGCVQRVEATDE